MPMRGPLELNSSEIHPIPRTTRRGMWMVLGGQSRRSVSILITRDCTNGEGVGVPPVRWLRAPGEDHSSGKWRCE